jgi:hypothetical protein
MIRNSKGDIFSTLIATLLLRAKTFYLGIMLTLWLVGGPSSKNGVEKNPCRLINVTDRFKFWKFLSRILNERDDTHCLAGRVADGLTGNPLFQGCKKASCLKL